MNAREVNSSFQFNSALRPGRGNFHPSLSCASEGSRNSGRRGGAGWQADKEGNSVNTAQQGSAVTRWECVYGSTLDMRRGTLTHTHTVMIMNLFYSCLQGGTTWLELSLVRHERREKEGHGYFRAVVVLWLWTDKVYTYHEGLVSDNRVYTHTHIHSIMLMCFLPCL